MHRTQQRRIIQFVTTLWLLSLFFIAPMAYAVELVPCDGPSCKLEHVIVLVQNIVGFLLMLAVPLAAIGFAIAGFIIMTAGGNESRIKTGKDMMWGVLLGLLIVSCAFLIVQTLLAVLQGGTIP
jgi:hypothetical protein